MSEHKPARVRLLHSIECKPTDNPTEPKIDTLREEIKIRSAELEMDKDTCTKINRQTRNSNYTLVQHS